MRIYAGNGLGVSIAAVRTPHDIAATVELFRAYAAALDIDLAYQDFETELETLPGKYAAPKGQLLLARDAAGGAIGCVAMRPLEQGVCEMKRLYVAPAGRGFGLGKALVEAIVKESLRAGYDHMRLDTLPSMRWAVSIYRKAGFRQIPPYYDTPVAGTLFFARALKEQPRVSWLRRLLPSRARARPVRPT